MERISNFWEKLKLLYALRFHTDRGAIALGGVRTIVAAASILDATRRQIAQIGPAGDRFMYQAGKEAGKEYAEAVAQIKGDFSSEEAFTSTCEAFGTLTGWGDITVVAADFDAHEFRIELANTIFSTDEAEATCEYNSGMMAGAATVILDEPMDVKEVQCSNDGHTVCIHEMKPADAIDAP